MGSEPVAEATRQAGVSLSVSGSTTTNAPEISQREKAIRDLVGRVMASEGISREFSLLNVNDAIFLLTELDKVRAEFAAWSKAHAPFD